VGINSAIREELQLYSQLDLEFDYSKRLPERENIFEFISWINSLCFRGNDRDALKEEVKTYLTAQSSPLNSTIFFFRASIIYGAAGLFNCVSRC
jgi:hypothetical protein